MKKKKLFFVKFLIFSLVIFSSKIFSSLAFEIEANKVSYENNNEIIIADGNAVAKDLGSRVIRSDKIVFYKKKKYHKYIK